MMRMAPWLPMNAAAILTGRSKRTIRRWLADPDLKINTEDHDGVRVINTQDLLRVERWKHAYTIAPTFGRKTSAKV